MSIQNKDHEIKVYTLSLGNTLKQILQLII